MEIMRLRGALDAANKKCRRYVKRLKQAESGSNLQQIKQTLMDQLETITTQQNTVETYKQKYAIEAKRADEADLARKDMHVELNNKLYEALEALKNQTAMSKIYQQGGHQLAELLFHFGKHVDDCNIWELMLSGRLIDIPEVEICNCGWTTLQDEMTKAKGRGEAGQTNQQDVQVLVDLVKQEM